MEKFMMSMSTGVHDYGAASRASSRLMSPIPLSLAQNLDFLHTAA